MTQKDPINLSLESKEIRTEGSLVTGVVHLDTKLAQQRNVVSVLVRLKGEVVRCVHPIID